jgi:hypothetical protein
MTRLPINYQNAIIYKIVCKDLDVKECYVGSTTDFRKRKNGHKTDCINVKSKHYYLNVYKFIRDNGGWDNWDMVLIEKYPCDDNLELHQRERYWIEELNASLNKSIPSRNQQEYQKEWYKANKEKRKIQTKDYYEENKDKIKIQTKDYYEENKDKIKIRHIEYRETNKEKAKEYRETNKDKMKEYHKEYYQTNKDKLNQKYDCKCGGKYTHQTKSHHLKTKLHQAYIQSTFV